MRKKLTMLMASLFLVLGTAWAQAPVDSPEQAITGLLNRIGGNGAADKFEIVIAASLAENGKDVFIITSQNGKPSFDVVPGGEEDENDSGNMSNHHRGEWGNLWRTRK